MDIDKGYADHGIFGDIAVLLLVKSYRKVNVPFQTTVELISNQIEANTENDNFLSEQTERLDKWLKEALGENVDEQSEAVRKA
jgi:hypothetical protein